MVRDLSSSIEHLHEGFHTLEAERIEAVEGKATSDLLIVVARSVDGGRSARLTKIVNNAAVADLDLATQKPNFRGPLNLTLNFGSCVQLCACYYSPQISLSSENRTCVKLCVLWRG